MNQPAENPRAVPGSNQAPDFAKQTTDRLAEDFGAVVQTVTDLLAEARELPAEVTTDEQALTNGALIKRFRDVDARLENHRVVEKEPYLRGGEAVDAFFFGQRDKIGKRNKRDHSARPGAIDVLEARNQAHMDRKLAEEQAKRDREAQQAAREAQRQRDEAAKLAREAEERRLEAERARAPAKIEEKTAIADKVEEQASVAGAEAQVAADVAQDAHIATLAKPADMVRTRGDDGVMLTMRREPYAILKDETKLDKEKLWAFVPLKAKEQALGAWARNTGHTVPMDGAEIGFRNKSVTR